MTRLPLFVLLIATQAYAAAPPVSSDPLPDGAIARLGHARMLCGPPTNGYSSVAVSPDGEWIVANGHWFRHARGEQRSVSIPEGYKFARFFSGGGYLVGGERDSLVFAPGVSEPIARVRHFKG